jgi:hypothetical protein
LEVIKERGYAGVAAGRFNLENLTEFKADQFGI